MTEPAPDFHPVGDPVTAFRRAMARSRKAENTVRALREEVRLLKALLAAQEARGGDL